MALKQLFIATLLLVSVSAQAITEVIAKFTIKGLSDTTLILANHYGNKQFVRDTFRIDNKGVCEWEHDSLNRGIYLAVLPALNNAYFEFLVTDDTEIEMATSKDNLVKDMKVAKSEQNRVFYSDLQMLSLKGAELNALKAQMDSLNDEDKNGKAGEAIKAQMGEYQKAISEQRLAIVKDHPTHLYAKILKGMRDIDVPEAPEGLEKEDAQRYRYNYWKDNYWMDFDWAEEGLAYSPVFHNKLVQYFTKVIPQAPDSLAKYCDFVLTNSRPNNELFKYALVYFLNESAKSKIMGMDALYVHIAKNYYMKGDAPWMDSTALYRMEDRLGTLERLLIGQVAPDIKIKDINFMPRTLHGVQSKYTLLYIWSPTCGHCKKSAPKLAKLSNTFDKNTLEIFAVATEEFDKWKEFITENKLENMIHCYPYQPKDHIFRDAYDINSTPSVWLLDEDKKIIAKKLSIDQVMDYVAHLEGIELPEEESKETGDATDPKSK